MSAFARPVSHIPENVVERRREKKHKNLTFQNEKLRETATLLATTIRTRPQAEWQSALDQLAATGKLSAIEIISDSGQILGHSEAAISDPQKQELQSILARGRQSDQISSDTPLSDGKGFDLTTAPLAPGIRLIL